MVTILLVGVGGAFGSIARFSLAFWITKLMGKAFPYGILLINILGCLLIGILAAYFQKTKLFDHIISLHLRNLLITGFLGGFTTFSSFSLDALMLFEKGFWLKALSYIILSVVVSMIAVTLGFLWVKRYY
ncbi:fluoride efflux transporter CrcB [Fangia hongkongensis]|uniref:fluoride efflux transporter CrcB n=1 Tax=Fangia hongkongensis TaxID=270495 RepID=UPI0003715125|nr:fluoride efflux transporter CrcB [Fangia hongkongensis]